MVAVKKILKISEIPAYRNKFAQLTKYTCPICKTSLVNARPVLDHDHSGQGFIRATICNSCNEGEGRVLAGMKMRSFKENLSRTDPVQWLRNLADYWEFHMKNPSGIVHPTFDTSRGKQKPMKRVVKRGGRKVVKKKLMSKHKTLSFEEQNNKGKLV